jgi:hypothetical protein
MKKTVIILPCALMVLGTASAKASDFGLNMNINIGNQPRVAPPPAVVVPVPAPRPPVDFVIEEPPTFIVPQPLGFYVAVGVPYDLFYTGNAYFIYRDNAWYRGRTYNGPWAAVSYRSLPPGLRRQRMDRIRVIRDEEYGRYRDDEDHYGGRRFRPDKEWKHERREEKAEWKEEKRREKEERKWEKHHGHGRDDD